MIEKKSGIIRKVGTKRPSPITLIMRRDSPKYGRNKHHSNFRGQIGCSTEYPRVRQRKDKMPVKTWNLINNLYHDGWKINWISKKLGIDWHSVKMAVDDEYRKKRLNASNERTKRILADPIKRKIQFARVDAWKKDRMNGKSNYDKRFRKWKKHQNRIATQKYDATHREERRVKAIIRYNEKKEMDK